MNIKHKSDKHKQIALWAANCAEQALKYARKRALFRRHKNSKVFHGFEKKYPNDKRPRKAIKAARDWAFGRITIAEARKFALDSHKAARKAKDQSAMAAARSAGHAAATAHVWKHAFAAESYAVKSQSLVL
ncbi:MAG: hypothetical protein NTX24_00890 [Candidatus Pacearchaeota archaeon]|nr:hypothetical protein [Candidatus Pacearchaeota archaeon]